jgi:hypothetical protein
MDFKVLAEIDKTLKAEVEKVTQEKKNDASPFAAYRLTEIEIYLNLARIELRNMTEHVENFV